MKYKIIAEYPTYYLCEHMEYGYKECFNKVKYKPNEEGYIIKEESNMLGRPGVILPQEKINHSFGAAKIK